MADMIVGENDAADGALETRAGGDKRGNRRQQQKQNNTAEGQGHPVVRTIVVSLLR